MKNWMKTVVPGMAGLALAGSLLVAPGSSAQAAPVPVAPQAVPVAAPTEVGTDAGSVTRVNPVAYGTSGSLYVDFSKSATIKKRKVQFQRWNGASAWVNVGAKVKMSSKGVAILKTTPDVSASYRAVAVATKYKKKLRAAVPSKVATSPWAVSKGYDFSAPLAGSDWTPRNEGSYAAGGRQCSAPYATNTVVGGGVVSLAVSKEKTSTNIAKAKAACEKSINATKSYSKKVKKSLVKKTPIYRNAMVSTQGAYTVKTGIVAARIKFPKNTGMHSGVWLQSGGPEIDMVESYGYGKGITSVVHLNGKENKLYKAKMKKKSWWSKYHVFSVEWTRTQVIFRIDGTVTKTKSFSTPPADYFLVMSNLSSDWELNKIKDSKLGSAKMSVDWVKVWATK